MGTVVAGYLGLFRCLLRTSLIAYVVIQHIAGPKITVLVITGPSVHPKNNSKESDERITAKSEGADKVYLVFLGCERVPF